MAWPNGAGASLTVHYFGSDGGHSLAAGIVVRYEAVGAAVAVPLAARAVVAMVAGDARSVQTAMAAVARIPSDVEATMQ